MPRGPGAFQPTLANIQPHDPTNVAVTAADTAPRPPVPDTVDFWINFLWDKANPGLMLRLEQREALRFFACESVTAVRNRGLLLIAPTGWGKSACILMLPSLMERVHPRRDNLPWKILVIQPYKALLRSTVAEAVNMGFDAVFLGGEQQDRDIIRYSRGVDVCVALCAQ
jgi:superfamily II DNA or RNA helicase